MNETLQQFCHRILPIVQAGAEGKDIESKCLRDADDWGSHEARLFLHDYEYRIAQPKATPLPITPEMWAMIDPKYEWAVLNENGEMKLTSNKPKWWSSYLGTGWHVDIYNETAQLPLAIDTTGIIHELSLTKRPDAESKPEPHDDCQLLVVSSWGAKSPLESALDEMCACGVPDRLFKFLSNIPTK